MNPTPSLKPLYPHQQVALDGLRSSFLAGSRRPMMQLSTGAGKCLGLGTPVLLFDGRIVAVEDVRAGDALMGPDSMPRAVLSTCRGSGELFRITPTKGQPWVCNDVHVLTLVETRSGRIVDIGLPDYLASNRTFKHLHKLFSPADGVDFEPGDDPDIDGYWLGLWVGDGTKALHGVAVSKPDAEVEASCRHVADAHGLMLRIDGVDRGCAMYHIHGGKRGGRANPVLDKLRGWFGHPARRFPHEVLVASRIYRQEFLAGVIDSDGHVNNKCVEIAQKNKEFADGIMFVARSLGLRAHVRDKFVNGTAYRRIGLSGDFSGIATRIPRKRLDPRQQVKCATRSGFSVEPIGEGSYAGFELSGDGRFLLGDFTVTHNTVLACHIVTGAQSKGKRVAFTVPALGLIDQTFARFTENGLSPGQIGVLQGDHPWRRPQAPIQICSAQTLAVRGWPEVDVVVIDEAHIRHAVYERWMAECPHVLFIGLSATPWARGLGKLFDDLIKPTTMQELIDAGFLSKFVVFAPSHPDLTGVKTVAGDYHEGQLAERMDQPELVADVVNTWLGKARGLPTLCFATGRAHAKNLHDRFEAAGVRVAYIDANTPREERDQHGKDLASGKLEVITNIGTCTTGIDWDVRCISLCRPTKSDSLFCLDAETEILTNRGWLGIGEVKKHDLAAARVEDGSGVWSRVVETIERDMSENEFWVEYNAPRANFRVTDRHNLLFWTNSSEGQRLGPASDVAKLANGVRMPTAVSIKGPGVKLTDDDLYLIGMMMTDGSWHAVSGTYAGAISQSERHPEIIARIERCLQGCGIAYTKTKRTGETNYVERFPRWVFSISAGKPRTITKPGMGTRVHGVRGFGYLLPYLSKDLSPALMGMTRLQLLTFLGGIFDGNGSKMKSPSIDWTPRSPHFCLSSKIAADRVQALCAINGMTCNVRQYSLKSHPNGFWSISYSPDANWRSVGGCGDRPHIEIKPATAERVWCVETEAGTIVTRRKGKVTVMGNCQIIGRGLRNAPGKSSCLILDHSDTHLRLGMVTDVEHRHTELDDGRKVDKSAKSKDATDPLPKECLACGCLVPAGQRDCPSCGVERPMPKFEEAKGELREFTGTGRPPPKTWKRQPGEAVADALKRMGEAAVWAQIRWVQEDRNRARGWAAHKFRELWDRWPPRSIENTRPEEPVTLLLSWLRSRDIAWARSKANANTEGPA